MFKFKNLLIVNKFVCYKTIRNCIHTCHNVQQNSVKFYYATNKQLFYSNFIFASNKNCRYFSLLSCHKIMFSSFFNQELLHKLKQYNLFSTTQKHLENDIFDERSLENVSIKYPHPKNVLHSYYDMVCNDLKSPVYKVGPQYKMMHHRKGDKKPREWICTYSLKWPQEIKIHATAVNKSEASDKAAIKVLAWLERERKINSNGQPLTYDKDAYNKIVRKNYIPLILNNNVESKLKSISDMYEANLKPNIELQNANQIDEFEDTSVNISDDDNFLQTWTSAQRKGAVKLSAYKAKESIPLPIQKNREEFENLLDKHRVIIIRGEPGCGKSTRIPQYILEYWGKRHGTEPVKIVITQPRRIAAISLAERVASERQENVGDIVGYHVRLKSKLNPYKNRILYCTTGILLRQLQADAMLSQCTHIVLDEAHERDVNTDLLMNLLRRTLELNPTLKIIVMSATIDVALFQKYFNNAPVMNVPGFTYPVKINFLENIKLDLKRTRDMCHNSSPNIIHDDIAKVIKWLDKTKPEGAILCFLPGWDEISKIRKLLTQFLNPNTCLILALHSKLSDEDQHKIFSRPPPGIRKIILATNIAETSVTVDDVVYVVDCGIHKETRFDYEKGIMCMDNHWISQSSMNQRKGRAGRVQAGESYHLYPKSKYDSLSKFSIPEILRVSLTKIVLDAKVLSHNMDAIQFFNKLPCPPEEGVILKAIDELKDLELLDENENYTPLGKAISEFQLPPKLSKALVQSMIYKCVTPIVDIVTIFSSESEMFSTALIDKQSIKKTKEQVSKTSDHISLMILFEQWANLINDENFQEAAMFCTTRSLVPHKLKTLQKLQDIHFGYLEKYMKNVLEISDTFSDNEEIIKGVLLSGVGTVLMHRNWDIVKGRLKNTDVFITGAGQKATITPESVNNKKNEYRSPFFVYINETRSVIRRTTLIRETSLISPLTLIMFKNKSLKMYETHDKSDKIKDAVILQMVDTKFKFLCSRKQAYVIIKCKEAMKNMENYFIYQMTQGGQENDVITENWDKVLLNLNELLNLEKT